jgi:hypothetical protein
MCKQRHSWLTCSAILIAAIAAMVTTPIASTTEKNIQTASPCSKSPDEFVELCEQMQAKTTGGSNGNVKIAPNDDWAGAWVIKAVRARSVALGKDDNSRMIYVQYKDVVRWENDKFGLTTLYLRSNRSQ